MVTERHSVSAAVELKLTIHSIQKDAPRASSGLLTEKGVASCSLVPIYFHRGLSMGVSETALKASNCKVKIQI